MRRNRNHRRHCGAIPVAATSGAPLVAVIVPRAIAPQTPPRLRFSDCVHHPRKMGWRECSRRRPPSIRASVDKRTDAAATPIEKTPDVPPKCQPSRAADTHGPRGSSAPSFEKNLICDVLSAGTTSSKNGTGTVAAVRIFRKNRYRGEGASPLRQSFNWHTAGARSVADRSRRQVT
jgi:hypothetical protein